MSVVVHACARNLPQHFNGCTCTSGRCAATGEATGVDLTVTVGRLESATSPDGLATRTTLVVEGTPVAFVDHEEWDDDENHGVLIHQIETVEGHRGRGYAMTLLQQLHDTTDGDLLAENFTPQGEVLRERYESLTGRRYSLIED